MPDLTAVVLAGRSQQSTPERGGRGGNDGAKRQKGSNVYAAVDTIGHVPTLHVMPSNAQDRAPVRRLAGPIQARPGGSRYRWPSSTRATRGTKGRSPRRTASGWKASCRKRSAASCCCRTARLSSARSAERAAFAGSPRRRTVAGNGRGAAFRRLCLFDAPSLSGRRRGPSSITRSRPAGRRFRRRSSRHPQRHGGTGGRPLPRHNLSAWCRAERRPPAR